MLQTTLAQDLPFGWSAYPHTVSGYRVQYTFPEACRSVFWPGHNEFWMIWTDVAPLLLFAWMYWKKLSYAEEEDHDDDNDDEGSGLLIWLMFCGALLCRTCSLTYHTFNCVSLSMHHRLLFMDLIGIASNALGVPWVAFLASSNHNNHNKGPYWRAWTWLAVALTLLMYAVCVLRFAQGMMLQAPHHAHNPPPPPTQDDQRLLVGLAAVGNLPTLFALAGPGTTTAPPMTRALLFLGVFFFAAGYTLFFAHRLPESLLPPGSADGRWWHSHVLWHVSSALGQLAFLGTAFHFSEANGVSYETELPM